MFGGGGFYRGSSVLISGSAGTGKSSLAAHFADAACRRGERCLYFAFEELPEQIVRNMRSIGIDLAPCPPPRQAGTGVQPTLVEPPQMMTHWSRGWRIAVGNSRARRSRWNNPHAAVSARESWLRRRTTLFPG